MKTLISAVRSRGNNNFVSILSLDIPLASAGFARVGKERRTQKRVYRDLICPLFGHRPVSPGFENLPNTGNLCRCGSDILGEETETRLRHVPDCFLKGHTCMRLDNRDGHHEFVCSSCGHPILIEEERTKYSKLRSLHKKQRYLCSVFGHQVHKVVDREGMTEYACRCGHSFLKTQNDLGEVKHPMVCLFSGHFVTFLAHRGDYAEYLCRNCGHTFYFPGPTVEN
jgi:DNA-directed RNA polymerase subunit RPC12/RpoP